MATDTMTTLNRVPSPGRSRSGIHSASTTRPRTSTAVPMDQCVCSAIPWASVVHGLTPSPDAMASACPVPNTQLPAKTIIRVRILGRKTIGCGALHEVVGSEPAGRSNERQLRCGKFKALFSDGCRLKWERHVRVFTCRRLSIIVGLFGRPVVGALVDGICFVTIWRRALLLGFLRIHPSMGKPDAILG